jgi:broad specificity phosphatase PhoE
MRTPFRFLLAACALTLAACSTTPMDTASATVTFVVVRHAEKTTDDPRDPSLSDAGLARASTLAALLQARDVVAAYATDFRRTQSTASPSAKSHRIGVTSYDASEPAAAFAARLRHDHVTGTVLVVGHSNTVPGIVSALCACEVAPIDDRDYGNLYEVRIAGDAAPVLSQRRY